MSALQVSNPEPLDGMVDRCPCARPFTATHPGCPAYQEATFTATDSMNRRLGTHLTCRHLTFGSNTGDTGGFYPRCALGGRDSRLRWLADIRPERLEAVQALSEEFDAFSVPHLQALDEARQRVISSPGAIGARTDLEGLVAEYSTTLGAFLEARSTRLEQAGISALELTAIIERRLRGWARSREDVPAALEGGPTTGLDIALQAFLGGARDSTGESAQAARSVVHDDGALRVTRRVDGGGLEVAGDVDAATAPALEAALASALDGGTGVEVDISGVLFCDLAGIRTLLRIADGTGARLAISGIPDHLDRVMRAAGWTDRAAALGGARA